jgi:cytochrome P450
VQRDGAHWEDPEEFRPERWLGEDGGAAPYTSIPFGGGTRRCVGASFALMEMRAVLRAVLGRVELRPSDAAGEKPRVHHVTLVPSRGGRVVVERRLEPAAATGGSGSPAAAAGCPHAAV